MLLCVCYEDNGPKIMYVRTCDTLHSLQKKHKVTTLVTWHKEQIQHNNLPRNIYDKESPPKRILGHCTHARYTEIAQKQNPKSRHNGMHEESPYIEQSPYERGHWATHSCQLSEMCKKSKYSNKVTPDRSNRRNTLNIAPSGTWREHASSSTPMYNSIRYAWFLIIGGYK